MLLNKYEIISNISNGEFGEVIKVKYNDIFYAVKCGAKDLIKYEIQIYKHLRAISNISTIHDVFEHNNKMYMVMDLYSMTLVDYKLQNSEHENYVEQTISIFKDLINLIKTISCSLTMYMCPMALQSLDIGRFVPLVQCSPWAGLRL